jgi:hypothetical protein
VVESRVVDNAMAEQWPILHQPEHERSPVFSVQSLMTGLERFRWTKDYTNKAA